MKDINSIIKIALQKEFDQLTDVEKMVLALKGALNHIKTEDDPEAHAFYAAFIGKTAADLKEKGIII